MWVGVRWQLYPWSEGLEMYFWVNGNSRPSQTRDTAIPCALQSWAQGAFLRQGIITQTGALVQALKSSAITSSTAASSSHAVSSLSGISSLAFHCSLPDLIHSLTLCCHRMPKNLPNGNPALLLWNSGPRIPASLLICPRRHPTRPAVSHHSYICHLTSPNPALSPFSVNWVVART